MAASSRQGHDRGIIRIFRSGDLWVARRAAVR